MQRRCIWDCVGALSGAAAVGLTIVYMTLADPYDATTNPNPYQSSDVIAQALIANRDNAQAAVYFGLGSAFLLLWFFGYLRHYLQRAEGQDGWLTSVAYGSGLVVVGLVILSVSFTLAESTVSTYGADTQVAKTFLVYGWNAATVQSAPLGALVTSSMVLGFRHAALPSYLTWFSVPVLAFMLVMGVSAGGQATVVGYVWVALTSIVLSIRAWLGGQGLADGLRKPVL